MTSIVLRAGSIYNLAKGLAGGDKFTVNNIEIDNVLSYNYDITKSITNLPLELGADINDHSFLNASRASCVIMESKFRNIIDQIGDIARSFPQVSRDSIYSDVLNKDSSFYKDNKSSQKMKELVQLINQLNVKFQLDFEEAQFANMTLTGISVIKNAQLGGGFQATLSFIQINEVSKDQTALGAIVDTGFRVKETVSESIENYIRGL